MKHEPLQRTRFFYVTTPLPCPYFADRVERRVVTELVGRDAGLFHDALSLAGFRRSHGIAYAPACPNCSACVPVRVVVDGFRRSRSQRRVWNANASLTASPCPPLATEEQYALFSRYQSTRHGDGDMTNMDFADYRALVEDTPVETMVIEFRDEEKKLIGACLTDRLGDGLSAVYSFFEPGLAHRSLGTYVVLWLVEQARALELPYVYLGFWIGDCDKMSYKSRFQPLEYFTQTGWGTPEEDANGLPSPEKDE